MQQADIAVPLGEIDLVKVGQTATLTADGTAKKLHGTVRSVGLLSSTSGSSTTFPVTVELNSDSPAVFDGSGADVIISTASATNVVTVPNSAVHTTANSRHTVTVVDGTKTTTVPVTVGVVGSALTEIKSGLKTGQQVELADLSQQLPSSSTSSNTGTSRFAGGFGGAGGGFNFGGAGRPGG
jgi:multidrug efflux pump subunit AcrA (membrane-fusion protein)